MSGERAPVFRKQFSEVEDACALAQAMVDTVREPLIVLDKDLRVVAASRSFYVKFAADPRETRGKRIYELGDREWDIPKLRSCWKKLYPIKARWMNTKLSMTFPASDDG